jgi:hypothetical protein
MSVGKTVLSSLFGSSASAITSGLSSESGLRFWRDVNADDYGGADGNELPWQTCTR